VSASVDVERRVVHAYQSDERTYPQVVGIISDVASRHSLESEERLDLIQKILDRLDKCHRE